MESSEKYKLEHCVMLEKRNFVFKTSKIVVFVVVQLKFQCRIKVERRVQLVASRRALRRRQFIHRIFYKIDFFIFTKNKNILPKVIVFVTFCVYNFNFCTCIQQKTLTGHNRRGAIS